MGPRINGKYYNTGASSCLTGGRLAIRTVMRHNNVNDVNNDTYYKTRNTQLMILIVLALRKQATKKKTSYICRALLLSCLETFDLRSFGSFVPTSGVLNQGPLDTY